MKTELGFEAFYGEVTGLDGTYAFVKKVKLSPNKTKLSKIDCAKPLAVFGQLLRYGGIDWRNLNLAGMHLRH